MNVYKYIQVIHNSNVLIISYIQLIAYCGYMFSDFFFFFFLLLGLHDQKSFETTV